MSYPIVKLPYAFEVVSNIKPKMPARPIPPNKPIKPVFVEPPKDAELNKPTKWERPPDGCSPMIWGGSILFLATIPMMCLGWAGFSMFVIGAAIGISLFRFGYSMQETHDSYSESHAEKVYMEKLVEYNNELKRRQDLYNSKIEIHNAKVREYEAKLRQYESKYKDHLLNLEIYQNECNRLMSKISLEAFRLDYIKKALKETAKPVLNNDRNNILTGVSEEYFFLKLKEFFGTNVVKGYTIPYVLKGYLPDIVLYIEEVGLCVDIEIDEPYIGSSGEPIHYMESENDKERNINFTNAGWIVIRFSEEQVVKYPSECCCFIVKTLEDITKGIVNRHTFSCLPISDAKLPQVNQWTKDDAHKLAFIRYRNNYLPRNLVEKVSHENIEWFTRNKKENDILGNLTLDDFDLPF